HAGLIAWALRARERTVEREVEAPAIVAALLTEAPDVSALAPAAPSERAAPAAATAPAAPRDQARARPRPSHSSVRPNAPPAPPAPTTSAAPVAPTTALQPSSAAPAQNAPAPGAPASPSASLSAPGDARPAPVSSEPKTVSHVDCDIPAPDYPEASKRRNESGTAIIRFVVGMSGRIESVQLQKSSGYARLDDAALAAIHAGTCQTYRENGEPVRAAYSQSFVFGLSD
ncbi:MAG: energy transducer TonB, partial [Paraburkholderia sp.]|nr:energy transducer TonB [Paraburkholderia sp.]